MIILFVALALVIPAPAQAEFRDFWAYVYTWDGSMGADGRAILTRVTSGITFKVLQTGSDSSETLYYYGSDALTSLTNPVTTTSFASDTICKDMVRFRTDPTDTNDDRVDLMVINTDGGGYVFFEDFNYQNDHAIVIDERPGIVHNSAIWFAVVSSGGIATEVDTGIVFKYDTVIQAVTAEVVTVEASSCTLNVGLKAAGTGGDVDGFIAAMSMATAGFPDNTITTVGDLLDDGTDVDPFGHTIRSANEQDLVYQQAAGTAAANTAAGYIHWTWFRTR